MLKLASLMAYCSIVSLCLGYSGSLLATGGTPGPGEKPALSEEEIDTLRTDSSSNENPDAGRKANQQALPDSVDSPDDSLWTLDPYGSVRLHGINHYDPNSDATSFKFADGESRIGVSGEWKVAENWTLFGRLEAGFDILDTVKAGAGESKNGVFIPRLHKVGIESDHLYLTYGKSWSVYYTVAGAADRFSIFGGEAVGLYNAGSDGGATGTGRADDAIQAEVFIDLSRWLSLKPFNINLQYQHGEPIPKVKHAYYGNTWSASTWLEGDNELGIGAAYHRAVIDGPLSPELLASGIDGDATSSALAVKTYGDQWLVSLVISSMDNIETTNENKYINGNGSELFAQWQYTDNWWLVGGGNWLRPDDSDPDAGAYELKYGVLGLRYTFDSFNRMVYAEWRDDHGTLANGKSPKNEITVGFRWDFNY